MARKKQSPPMGHNPLAWLAENETHSANPTKPTVNLSNDNNENENKSENNVNPMGNNKPSDAQETEIRNWTTIELPAVLTLSELSAFHAQLSALIGQRIRLSGKAITRIDTASLQVLLALMRDHETTVGWLDASPYLCQAANILGLTHELNLSEFNS
jgi:ABC-type transporter Mla MlaB component